MEFILISESKIKIMLTPEDLDEFDIDADELDYSNTETKRMFWDILSRAKHCTGFDTDGQKVLVQLYPSRHGGCELFVTKIGVLHPASDERATDDYLSPIISKNIMLEGRGSVKNTAKKLYTAFKFSSLSNMISVCKALDRVGYAEESSAYISDDDHLYLILCGIDTSGYEPIDKYSFLTEYGSNECYLSTERHLCEHGRVIRLGDAVQTLSTL